MRDSPYGAFNFHVDIGDGMRAGFSEVSGLDSDLSVADYRGGNAKGNLTPQPPRVRKPARITLKLGVMDVRVLDWLERCRSGHPVEIRRDIVIRLQGLVPGWKVKNAMPIKWTGPSLSARGGNDVAMEELVLSAESVSPE